MRRVVRNVGFSGLAFIALVVGTFAISAAGAPVKAELSPSGAVTATGTLGEEADADYWLLPHSMVGDLPADPIFTSPKSVFTIVEERHPKGTDETDVVEDLLAKTKTRPNGKLSTSNNTRIWLLEANPVSHLEFRSFPYPERTTTFSLDGVCQLEPAGDGHDTTSTSRPGPGGNVAVKQNSAGANRYGLPSNAVAADCTLSSSWTQGPGLMFVTDLTVRLLDDDGRDQIIRTGRYEEPNPLVPGLQDEVERRLEVRSYEEKTKFSFNQTHHARLVSTFLAHVGTVSIPAGSEGTLEWGSLRSEGTLAENRIDGIFGFSAPSGDRLAIQGESLNSPDLGTATQSIPASDRVTLAVVSTMIAAGLLGVIMVWKGRWVLSGLFTRISSSMALSNASRSSVMELVRHNPGISVSQLSRQLGAGYNTVRHHVRVLNRQGLVTVRRFGWEYSLFPGKEGVASKQEVAILMRSGHVRVVVEELRANPSQSQASLASKVGVTQGRISQIFSELKRLGILEMEPDGRGKRYRLIEADY